MPDALRLITPDTIRALVTDQSRIAAKAAQARDRREAERLGGIQITDDGAVIAAESRIERIVYSTISAVADMESSVHGAESRAELDLLIASCAQLSEALWQCERTARTYREHFGTMRAK